MVHTFHSFYGRVSCLSTLFFLIALSPPTLFFFLSFIHRVLLAKEEEKKMNTQEKEKVDIVQTEELQPELQTDTISEPVTGARKTFKDRFAFLKNPNFYKVLVLGQVLSLCITGTNVISTKLNVSYQFSAPTMQTFLI
jgi:hypothetical protein